MQGRQQTSQCAQQVCWVPVERIVTQQGRVSHEDSASLNELAESIRRDGLIQPITVRPMLGGRFEIVSGNRRYLACRMLGMTHIDAVILEAGAQEATAQELIDRLLAGSMHYLEQGAVLRELNDQYALTQELLARTLGVTANVVGQRIRMAGLDEETRSLLMENCLPERCAAAMLRLPDAAMRHRILRQVARDHLTASEVELLVTSAQTHLPVPPPAGRTITLLRDSRLYLNAVRAIAAQMQEAGIDVQVSETTTPGGTTLAVTVPTRHRRAAKYQTMRNSQAVQCTSYRSHSPMG